MRALALVGAVVAVGCGPDFDALFHRGAAAPTQDDGGGASDAGPPGNGSPDDGGMTDGGDAGSELRSCTPTPTCANGDCTYRCEDGCACPKQAACSGDGTKTCSASCGASTCDVSCKPTDTLAERACSFEAEGALDATYTCGKDVKTCTATCRQGANCSLHCNPESESCTLNCPNDGSKCAIHCNGAANCSMSCSFLVANYFCLSGTRTCNRTCPP